MHFVDLYFLCAAVSLGTDIGFLGQSLTRQSIVYVPIPARIGVASASPLGSAYPGLCALCISVASERLHLIRVTGPMVTRAVSRR